MNERQRIKQAQRYLFAAAACAVLALSVWGHLRSFASAGPMPPTQGDALEYHQIAERWAEEGRYTSGGQGIPQAKYAVRVPGYPAFLVALHWAARRLGLSETALVRPANMALNLGTVVLVFLTGCIIGLPAAGAVAAGLVALYPPLVGAASENMPECLLAFLTAAGVLAMAAAFASGRSRFEAASGLLFGVATLVRASTQFLPVALLIGLLAARQRRWKAHIVAFTVAFAAALSPWLIRNYVVFHRPVGLTSVGGLNTWLGNYLPFHGVPRQVTYKKMVSPIVGGAKDEMRADRLLYRAAVRNIARYVRRSPLAYAGLLWEKNVRFWEVYRSQGSLPWLLGRVLTAGRLHAAILLLAMIGLMVALLSGAKLWIVGLAPAYLNVVHVLSYAEPGRYNLAVMPQVALLAGFAVVYLLPRIGGRQQRAAPTEQAAGALQDPEKTGPSGSLFEGWGHALQEREEDWQE